ncbi:DMT family transporter [Microbispora sp. NPDC088329]|uniref:DMT family transporter n=1 Tax=Microbispora sp. NPDC088329 TaxID=3154869 RepID=UPI003419AD28
MNHAPALSVRQGLVYVSTAAVAWGTGGPAGAMLHGAGQLSPVAVSFWRFACGAVLLLAVARSRPSWRAVLLVGPAMAVCQAAYFAAIAQAGVAVATMITMGATPLLVAAGGRVFLGEPLRRTGLGCAALAVCGLAMLVGGADAVTPADAGYSPPSSASCCSGSACPPYRLVARSCSCAPSPGSPGGNFAAPRANARAGGPVSDTIFRAVGIRDHQAERSPHGS